MDALAWQEEAALIAGQTRMRGPGRAGPPGLTARNLERLRSSIQGGEVFAGEMDEPVMRMRSGARKGGSSAAGAIGVMEDWSSGMMGRAGRFSSSGARALFERECAGGSIAGHRGARPRQIGMFFFAEDLEDIVARSATELPHARFGPGLRRRRDVRAVDYGAAFPRV